MIYSITASLASLIITRILAIFLYEDVMQKESEKKMGNLTKALLLKASYRGSRYIQKLKRGYVIVKTILILANEYIKKFQSNYTARVIQLLLLFIFLSKFFTSIIKPYD